MVIISQKRIKIILSCILISLFVFSMHIAKKENELDTNNKTSEVTATPVSGKTVILDARPSEFLMKEQRVKMV